ncbi:hypothetical protein SODALDRAFT_330891 [Sodiomyces alkalinus F11]|uniref:Uncharacterized protein n=1 Tax=Sodiomyces alkalinus (strain CBS 110278 / VKM F-3762 / F11) TaxID=1314773 RepID=A0A3N2Q334_SODAK|nr:hypothetical protein SODALDRAFT_330891 [Sodiomyces alkalinus F11]ROT41179.1 hypothetical protein SODALDRAFT_330891 [Sodiomyces alkalinus F11]
MTTYQAQSPALFLSYQPDEHAPDGTNAFDSIKSFLEPGSTATAEATGSSILSKLPAGPAPADGSDALWSLYNVLIGIAKQIPHDHPALVKLVRVVDRLGRSPKTTVTQQGSDNEETLRPLHTFGWSLRDIFAPPEFRPNTPSDAEKDAYLSTQAFMALLWSGGLVEGWNFALWQLRSALEEEVEQPEEEKLLVAAAALCVIHAGPQIWQLVVDPPEYTGPDNQSHRPGSRFDGPGGYNFKRWEFWLGAFEGQAEGEDLSCRLSKRAVAVMKGLGGDV